MMNPEDVTGIVQIELEKFTYVPPELLRPFLVQPYSQIRHWEYSKENESFPVWIVADFGNKRLALAYSEFGHGAYGDKWGIVPLDGKGFGMDDAWFLCLEDAFISSGFYKGVLPDNYEVR